MSPSTSSLRLRPELTCPHCWHRFPPEDICWIAEHSDLHGDPVAGPEAPLRFVPTQFDVDGNAIDAKGASCKRLACPRCHLGICRSLLELEPLFLSILGAPSSGKSFYLTSMIRQLEATLQMRISIGDADPESNATLTAYKETLFRSNSDAWVKLEKTQTEGDLYESVMIGGRPIQYPKPFVYAVRPTSDHSAAGHARKLSRALCLLEAGTDCLWRFIIEGTPEAAAIRRDPHKPKIDLCAQLGPPPDDELVDAARSGTAPQWSTPAPQTRRQPLRTAGTAIREEPLIPVEPRTPRPAEAPRIADRPTTLAYLEPERRIRLPWIIAGSVLLFLLITGGMIAVFFAGRISHELPMTSVADNRQQNEAASPAPSDLDADWPDAEEKPKPEDSPPPPDSEPVDEAPPAVELAIADPVEDPPTETAEVLPPPLADVIDNLHERLPLPETKQNKGLSGPGPSGLVEAARLAEIYVNDVENVDLRLEGEEFVLPTGIKFSIDEGVSPDKSLKTWKISQTDLKGIGRAMPIGSFRLHNRQLSFEWEQNLKSAKLKYCTLVIDAENATGKQTARCSLFKPIEQSPLKLSFDPSVYRTELDIDLSSLPRAEHLHMRILLRGIDHTRYHVSKNTLRLASVPQDKSIIDFRGHGGDREWSGPLVRIEVSVDRGENHPEFRVENFVYPPTVEFVGRGAENVPPDVVINRSANSIEFARISIRDEQKKNERLKADLNKGLRALGILIAERVKHERNMITPGAKDLARSQREKAEMLENHYKAAKAVANDFDNWLRYLKDVYQELEEKVKIDFELYMTVDGKEIDILRSTSRDREIILSNELSDAELGSGARDMPD